MLAKNISLWIIYIGIIDIFDTKLLKCDSCVYSLLVHVAVIYSGVYFDCNQSPVVNQTVYSYSLFLVLPGSLIGLLLAHDDDQAGTINSFLTYTILSQIPGTSPNAFSIDAASGRIQALRPLQRKNHHVYNLNVRVNDPGNKLCHVTHLKTKVTQKQTGRTIFIHFENLMDSSFCLLIQICFYFCKFYNIMGN